jgi:predicted MFS family arabinose efflux permease
MWLRISWAAACFGAIMGFSRLAYGLLVPAMHASLGGGLDAYGIIGAANLGGYLVGSLLATRLAALSPRPRINTFALCAMCAAMAASGFAHDLVTLGVLRAIVGIASGIALPLTLSLAVEGVAQNMRGRAAGLIWGGGTAGMALAGAGSLFLPSTGDTWRGVWFVMAAVGTGFALLYNRITRASGAKKGPQDDGLPIEFWARKKYLSLALGYGCFGFGFMDVLTFFGAAIAKSHATKLGLAVILLGVAGSLGALMWGPLVDRYRNGLPITIACTGCAIGALLMSASTPVFVLVGAALFGGSFISIPAMTGALVQQREPAQRYGRAFAMITSVLGVGMTLGPLTAGVLAKHFGTGAALELGAGALLIAASCCCLYRKPVSSEAAVPSSIHDLAGAPIHPHPALATQPG